MMIVGGGAFAFLGIPGIALVAVGEVCRTDYSDTSVSPADEDCTNVRTAGAVLAVVGLVGGVVGVVGLVQVIGNARDRRELNTQIEQLKQEQSLALDVRPRQDGAELALRLRF